MGSWSRPNKTQRLCYTNDKLKRKQMMMIFSHSPLCWHFPQGRKLYDSSKGKGVFIQNPTKMRLVLASLCQSSIICTPNSKDWSVNEASITNLAPPPRAIKTLLSIGVIFNNSLSMLTHVTAVCKSSFFHLRNIFKISKFLSHDTCKTLIHAFVTARIDYCNSLLYGQPKCILKRLQSVLNSAARLIHLTSRYEHVTPMLIQLHWLPIEQRITFKIAVITFKALHGAAPSYITDLINAALYT